MQAFDNFMMWSDFVITVILIVNVALLIGFFYLVFLAIKALRTYIKSKEVRQERALLKLYFLYLLYLCINNYSLI